MNKQEKVWMWLTIANVFYFGGWFLAIILLRASLWWVLFPVIIHWRVSDYIPNQQSQEEHE